MSGAERPGASRVLAWAPTVLVGLAVIHYALVRATSPQGFGRTAFQFRPYFSAHPGFVDLMKQYDRVAVEGSFEYYRRRGQ